MPFDSEIAPKSKDLIVLERARERIARGWCQGKAEGPDGSVCIIGALHHAFYGGIGPLTPEAAYPLRVAVEQMGLDPETVSIWNDAPGRTQAEVLARFDTAVAKLSARS